MVEEAAFLHWKELGSELEALLVEAELIRLHQPKYNIIQKDDKSNLYIVFTPEELPRVIAVHKQQVRELEAQGLDLKKDVFGPYQSGYRVKQLLRHIRRIFQWCNDRSASNRPCFYHHIGLCSGVCAGRITTQEYLQSLRRMKIFLRGKTKLVITDLQREMKKNAKLEQYEQAGKYRDQIQVINAILKEPLALGPDFELPHLSNDEHLESIVELRNILSQHLFLPKGMTLYRIEGYDISNTQGNQSSGSQVVFIKGEPKKQEYRMYNIKFKHTPDDYAMISEVLMRRQNHPEWGIPDLLVIDGGKGQLHAALSVWKWQVPIISLAKEPDRLIIFDAITGKYIQKQLGDDLASRLLRHVRDESHRFAKKQHVRRRNKSMLE